jgi:hypothetical protein
MAYSMKDFSVMAGGGTPNAHGNAEFDVHIAMVDINCQ